MIALFLCWFFWGVIVFVCLFLVYLSVVVVVDFCPKMKWPFGLICSVKILLQALLANG